MKRLALLVFILAAWFLGCGTPRDNAVRVANSAASFIDSAEDILAKQYERELLGCVDLDTKVAAVACQTKTKRRYALAWASHTSARASWLLLAATIEAADAGGEQPDPLELAKLLARLAKSLEAFKRIAEGSPEASPEAPETPAPEASTDTRAAPETSAAPATAPAPGDPEASAGQGGAS